MRKLIKPGTDNQPPGAYREVGPKGGKVSGGRVVNIDAGDRLPPTQKPGNKWTKQTKQTKKTKQTKQTKKTKQ